MSEGRRRGRLDSSVDESRSKRSTPSEFVRTQYGTPPEYTGGWGRNMRDVLMAAAAAEASRVTTTIASNQTQAQCNVCQIKLVNFKLCKRCRKYTCTNCERNCDICLFQFCSLCSLSNYKLSRTRTLCIDCDNDI